MEDESLWRQSQIVLGEVTLDQAAPSQLTGWVIDVSVSSARISQAQPGLKNCPTSPQTHELNKWLLF